MTRARLHAGPAWMIGVHGGGLHTGAEQVVDAVAAETSRGVARNGRRFRFVGPLVGHRHTRCPVEVPDRVGVDPSLVGCGQRQPPRQRRGLFVGVTFAGSLHRPFVEVSTDDRRRRDPLQLAAKLGHVAVQTVGLSGVGDVCLVEVDARHRERSVGVQVGELRPLVAAGAFGLAGFVTRIVPHVSISLQRDGVGVDDELAVRSGRARDLVAEVRALAKELLEDVEVRLAHLLHDDHVGRRPDRVTASVEGRGTFENRASELEHHGEALRADHLVLGRVHRHHVELARRRRPLRDRGLGRRHGDR